MSLISLQIPNLIQGVSQQPSEMRLPSQLTEQTNAYPSLTDGLTKRPPTQHVAKLASDANTQFVHFVNRDASERYCIRITSSGMSVFDLNGNAYQLYGHKTLTSIPFTFPSYLNSPSDLRAITIADYTFLLNRSKTVLPKTDAGSPSPDGSSLVTIVAGSYNTEYMIVLCLGVTGTPGINRYYSVKTWSGQGTKPTGALDPIPADIADALVLQLNQNSSNTYFSASVIGECTIKITCSLTSNCPYYTVKVTDGAGDTFIKCAKAKVERISDLPLQAPHGYLIGVGGNMDKDEPSAYYVKFVANDGVSGSGYWQETVGFNVDTALDQTTMPYVLIRRSDGNFACIPATWNTRQAGDDTSAPMPSFVNRKLKDIFLYRNRLGFVADDKVVLSEAGSYFNFFRTTTTQIIDSDPIDISVGHSKVASLQAAIEWDSNLMLFSDLSQFVLGTGNDSTLTPETAIVSHTTEFQNASSICRPANVGRSLLFLQNRGSSCGVREYLRIDVTQKYDAVDLTANVPSYIQGSPKQIAVSSNDSTAFLRTDSGLYNYKWYVNGNDKIQSAWSKWDIGSGAYVVGMEWYDQTMYMAVARGTATFLEKVEFPGKFTDSSLTWGIHLDRRFTATASTTGAVTGTTRITLPTGIAYATTPVVVIDGVQRPVNSIDSTYVTVIGDFNNKTAYVGLPYEMRWTFSRQFMRVQGKPLIEGRLQLTYGSLAFEDTGHFKVTVTPRYRDPFTYVFDGGYLGTNLSLGSPFTESRTFRYPVHCRSEDATVTVTSSSYLPCRIQSATFEAKYTARNQPV